MEDREQTSHRHREQRHRLGETIDRGAPVLTKKQQNGGNQRSSVTDTDPPDEIADGEAPSDGNINPPDADSGGKQVGDGDEQSKRQHKADAKADQPAARRPLTQDECADAVADASVLLIWGGLIDGHRLRSCCFTQRRIRISQSRQIGGTRAGVQFAQQRVIAGLLL